MSPDQNHNPPATKKDEAGSSGSRKAAAAAAAATAAAAEQAVKCPRCDSPNTKFCYYNNYSLTQPRHFCKTCRRYWTKGGALRNVPIGGGCRKNKKIKTSSSGVSSRLSDSDIGAAGGFKFFHGLSPAMDFQLSGGSLSSPSFPRLHHHNTGPSGGIYSNSHFTSFGVDSHAPAAASPFDPSANSLMGLSYGPPAVLGGGAIQEMNNNNNLNGNSNNIASSIESLSCINQDLHWKLQQQRLAMLFGGGGGDNKDHTTTTTTTTDHTSVVAPLGQHQHHQQQKLLEPILFRNLEISSNSRKDQGGGGGGDVANEWFFGNSYANHATAGGGGDGNDVSMTTTTSWSGVQGWSDNLQQQQHQQYTALP